MTTLSVSGGAHTLSVYGNGTVFAGNGNDTIYVHGSGDVQAGSGADWVTMGGSGDISVGGGSDNVSLVGSGVVSEHGMSGHDTINLGFGSDTIFEQGQATIYGEFGSASISGGKLEVVNSGWATHELLAMTGSATLIGGEYTNQFYGGTGNVTMLGSGKLGPDTFVGGAGGHDVMTGGSNTNYFDILKGNHSTITNFVAGKDNLTVDGHSLSYLTSAGDVHVTGSDTVITLDGGATQVTLQGVLLPTHK